MRPLTVAVVSHKWVGHIPAYHTLLVDKFRSRGCRVLSLSPTLPAAEAVPDAGVWWKTWGEPSAPGANRASGSKRGWLCLPKKLIWATGLPQAVTGFRLWRQTARVLDDTAAELGVTLDGVMLVFLGAGYCEHLVTGGLVDAVFRYPWAGILNGPTPVRSAPSRPTLAAWISRKEALLRARRCRAVLLTDGSFLPACAAAWPGVNLLVMPEMADLTAPRSDDARLAKVREFAAGRKIVGLLGNIAPRKGVREFLATARLALTVAPELCFLLAGEFSTDSCTPAEYRELEALIAAHPENCLFRPERIADGAGFNGFVSLCDVIYAAYHEFYFNSNLLTKAAHFRRPVVVSPGYVMAELTRRYRIGAVVAPADAAEMLAAMRALLQGRDRQGAVLQPDYAGLCALSAADKLDPVLTEVMGAWVAKDDG